MTGISAIFYFHSINNYRKSLQSMTKLGVYLGQKSVNKSEVARKTGLSRARMNELTLHDKSHLRAEELYLIALAIDVDPCELMEALYGTIKLKSK